MEFKWNDENGQIISCLEKNKILNESIAEVGQTLKDSYEDATLMGVSKESFMTNLQALIQRTLK